MATQKGRNWSSGDIVTAANLSSIERGVSAMAEEYTPTTWSNGDTVTAVGLNNIEQGIVNAGSGSSDFSTATVTITNNTGQLISFYGALALEEDGEYCSDTSVAVMSEKEVTVIMYKELAYCWTDSMYSDVTTTGNVSYNDGTITVTGDGTITISNSSTVEE